VISSRSSRPAARPRQVHWLEESMAKRGQGTDQRCPFGNGARTGGRTVPPRRTRRGRTGRLSRWAQGAPWREVRTLGGLAGKRDLAHACRRLTVHRTERWSPSETRPLPAGPSYHCSLSAITESSSPPRCLCGESPAPRGQHCRGTGRGGSQRHRDAVKSTARQWPCHIERGGRARGGGSTAENADGAEAGRELLCVLCDLCGEKGGEGQASSQRARRTRGGRTGRLSRWALASPR